MSIQTPPVLLQFQRLQVLRATLRKIEDALEPRTPTVSHLHSLILDRIADLEAAQALIAPGISARTRPE